MLVFRVLYLYLFMVEILRLRRGTEAAITPVIPPFSKLLGVPGTPGGKLPPQNTIPLKKQRSS